MITSKKIITLSLALVAFLLPVHSFAQPGRKEIKPDQYRAVRWTVKEGLIDDIANKVIRDAKGFLWVGSGAGLCRFDGSTFKKNFQGLQNEGRNADAVISFVEDSLKNIWIGTTDGLARYDMKADTFSKFTAIDPGPDRSIIPFWATKNAVYCLEGRGRIVAYDIQSLKPGPRLRHSDAEGLQIEYAVVDATNSLWALKNMPSGKTGLIQIPLEGGKPTFYEWPCYKNLPDHGHHSEGMQWDRKRNSIWINSPDGLLEFTMNDKQFHPIDAFTEFIKFKDYNCWVGIDIDRDGRIWLATQPKGILIYDPETRSVQPLFSDSLLQKEASHVNFQIYCDPEGIAWSTYWLTTGIYEFLPYDPPVKRYAAKPGMQDSLSNGRIYTIVPAAAGKIWIGTADGLNIFDPLTEKFEVLGAKDLPGIEGLAITPLHIDTVKQIAWLSAGSPDPLKVIEMKMFELDLKTRSCRPLIFRDGSKQLDGFVILPVETKPYKNGFLATDDNHGVFQIKAGTLFADLVIPFEQNTSISRVTLAEDQLLLQHWGSLPNFSYENRNGQWLKKSHPVDSLTFMSIYYDTKDQSFWVSFRYELVHYNHKFEEIKTYREENGYKGFFMKMLTDNDGNLWFGNNLEQLGRLNIKTGIITILSEAEGYYPKVFDWSVPFAMDAQGGLYFGSGSEKGTFGLDRISPDKYLSGITSSVYLRTLSVNQKPFPLSIGINNLEKISLLYNQNTISIETGILDLYAKGKGRIRYKLEGNGKTDDWQYGPAYYTIRYDGLTPGTYQLTLQASNAGTEFNSPQKVITIVIHPPFWQTWWFRILAGILIISTIYWIVQYRSRNLRKRNVMLEEKVLHRTKELKHSLEQVRETQQQLIQSEKMASLGELTAGIAHEIQNPLNFVNNFSEVSSELIDEMQEEADKGNVSEVKLIAADLKQNLEKINHHGKRAESIIKGMLQHSRTSSGQKEPTELNELVDEYLRLAYHGMRAKENSFNATMQSEFDKRIGKLNLVPQDIGRVLLNLFNNAFYSLYEKAKKGIEGYEPTIRVRTQLLEQSSGADRVILTVHDNGMGIPKKITDKIFQPFFTTKPTGQGTGLGLSLSYDIVKAHGGDFKVESVEGEWAEFVIDLPAQ